jgi:predicted DCC family thiol-disulfide oxidoreductase YuxK
VSRAVLIYDGECGLCRCVKRFTEPLDILHTVEWIPYQDPAALKFDIPLRDLEHSVHLISGKRRWSGFEAVKQVLLRLPPLYAAAGLAAARFPKTTIGGLALFFSPPFRPAGQALYDFVSEHRHMIPRNFCGCANQDWSVRLRS